MCETPPVENRKMTRWALAAKCGCFGASGSSARRDSAARSRERIPGSSSEPPTREWSTARRLGRVGDIGSPSDSNRQSLSGAFFPPPLRGRVRVGVSIFQRSTPHPNPPPQGGREQEADARRKVERI